MRNLIRALPFLRDVKYSYEAFLCSVFFINHFLTIFIGGRDVYEGLTFSIWFCAFKLNTARLVVQALDGVDRSVRLKHHNIFT